MQWPLAEGSGFLFSTVLDCGEKGELALTPTQITTNLQTHRAAGMEDKRYTMHSFRMGIAAGHNMDGMAIDVLMEYEGRKSGTVSRRYVKLTVSAAAGGMKRPRENGIHRGGHPTAIRAVCAFTYSVPTRQLKPDPQGADIDVWEEPSGKHKRKHRSYGHETGQRDNKYACDILPKQRGLTKSQPM